MYLSKKKKNYNISTVYKVIKTWSICVILLYCATSFRYVSNKHATILYLLIDILYVFIDCITISQVDFFVIDTTENNIRQIA